MASSASHDPTLERSFRGHKDAVTDVSFNPSMTQLASASLDASVMLFHFKPQTRAFRFIGHKGSVLSVDFSPKGNILASSSRDSTVRLWTPSVKGDVTSFKAHTAAVRSVRFSHDGNHLVTASDDKTLKVWSVHRQRFLYTLSGHSNWVRSARFSTDSRLIVSGSDDKTVKLWDCDRRAVLRTFYDHTGMVTSVAFHPDGNCIASCSTDKSIKIWDVRTNQLLQHYAAHRDAVNSVAFHPGGGYLVSTSNDGLIKIWDLREGRLFYTLHGHSGPTTCARFSPDGTRLATGGTDSRVLVWKAPLEMIEGQNSNEEVDDVRKRKKGMKFTSTANLKRRSTSRDSRPTSAASASSNTALRGDATIAPARKVVESAEAEEAKIFVDEDEYYEEMNAGKKSNRAFGENHLGNEESGTENWAWKRNEMSVDDGGLDEEDDLGKKDWNLRKIASTLAQVVRQLDVVTQTVAILESRLTICEDAIENQQRLSKATAFDSERISGNRASSPTRSSSPQTKATGVGGGQRATSGISVPDRSSGQKSGAGVYSRRKPFATDDDLEPEQIQTKKTSELRERDLNVDSGNPADADGFGRKSPNPSIYKRGMEPTGKSGPPRSSTPPSSGLASNLPRPTTPPRRGVAFSQRTSKTSAHTTTSYTSNITGNSSRSHVATARSQATNDDDEEDYGMQAGLRFARGEGVKDSSDEHTS